MRREEARKRGEERGSQVGESKREGWGGGWGGAMHDSSPCFTSLLHIWNRIAFCQGYTPMLMQQDAI